MTLRPFISFFFFFNDTATTEIYTLSLHDALPIYAAAGADNGRAPSPDRRHALHRPASTDRKSTRLNSSHTVISYAVFCLKKNSHHGESEFAVLSRHRHAIARFRRREFWADGRGYR